MPLGSCWERRGPAVPCPCIDIAPPSSETAVLFLSNVAVDMDNQEVSVVSSEELETVVRVLQDHLRNDTVASSAVFALKNYTYQETNLRGLRRFQELTSVLEDAAKYGQKEEIRADACEILERYNMLSEEDDALEEIAYSSTEEALRRPNISMEETVTTIRDVLKEYEWSERLICYTLESLTNVGSKSAVHLSRVGQSDVLKVVVNSMQKQSQSARVQEKACLLLRWLAERGGGRCRSLIYDADGCPAVVTAIRKHRGVGAVQIPAFGVLQALSEDPRCNQFIDRYGGLNGIKNGSGLDNAGWNGVGGGLPDL